jgi:hypothetical protein
MNTLADAAWQVSAIVVSVAQRPAASLPWVCELALRVGAVTVCGGGKSQPRRSLMGTDRSGSGKSPPRWPLTLPGVPPKPQATPVESDGSGSSSPVAQPQPRQQQQQRPQVAPTPGWGQVNMSQPKVCACLHPLLPLSLPFTRLGTFPRPPTLHTRTPVKLWVPTLHLGHFILDHPLPESGFGHPNRYQRSTDTFGVLRGKRRTNSSFHTLRVTY